MGDDYKELVCVVQARDTSITFDELHEKLLMFEASLHALTKAPLQFSPTANEATSRLEYRSQTSSVDLTPSYLTTMGHVLPRSFKATRTS